MSTIKAINIQHPSSANTNIVMDSSGNMTVAGTVSGGTPMSGMRNRIINGNFEFWQRGTSVTLVPNTLRWLADRWTAAGYQQGRHQRVSISSPPSGLSSRYALRVGSSTTAEAAGGTRMASRQKIESVNCYDLAGKKVTLSFWIKFSSATFSSVSNTGQSAYGDFYYTLMYNTTTTDSDAGQDVAGDSSSFLGITNGSFPTTWTRYTLTATVPAGCNNISINFQFGYLGSTSSADTNFYDIAQVQLEEGSIATPFERRLYGTELSLCQRYFCKTFPMTTAPAQNAGTSGAVLQQSSGSNNAFGTQFQWRFPVPMRVTPNITTYNPSAAANTFRNLALNTNLAIGSSIISINELSWQAVCQDSASSAGQQIAIHVSAEAEL